MKYLGYASEIAFQADAEGNPKFTHRGEDVPEGVDTRVLQALAAQGYTFDPMPEMPEPAPTETEPLPEGSTGVEAPNDGPPATAQLTQDPFDMGQVAAGQDLGHAGEMPDKPESGE